MPKSLVYRLERIAIAHSTPCIVFDGSVYYGLDWVDRTAGTTGTDWVSVESVSDALFQLGY